MDSETLSDWKDIILQNQTPEILVKVKENEWYFINTIGALKIIPSESAVKNIISGTINCFQQHSSSKLIYHTLSILTQDKTSTSEIILIPNQITTMQKQLEYKREIYLKHQEKEATFLVQITSVTQEATLQNPSKESSTVKFLAITFGITGLVLLAVCLMTPGLGTKFLERIMSFVH
jgi:hypothetical protein